MASISDLVADLSAIISADKHDGARFHFLSECVKKELIPEIPDEWFDDERTTPISADWKAIELTIFDNGKIPPPSKKRKRLRTTKTQFGGQIKMWRSTKINFSKPAPWSYTISFYPIDAAQGVADQLVADKFLNQETADSVNEIISQLSADNRKPYIGLARRHNQKVGTAWLKDHVFILSFDDDGPSETIISSPELTRAVELVDTDAADKPLSGKAIRQARIATDTAFDRWISD